MEKYYSAIKAQFFENFDLLFICCYLGVLLFPIPFFLLSHKFLLAAFLPFFYFIYCGFLSEKTSLIVVSSDLWWLLFLFLGFASYYWAANGSLVWYPSFGFLLALFWMLIFRSLSIRRKSFNQIFSFLGILFYVIVLLSILYHITFGQIGTIWNDTLGYNANYIAVFLIILFCFVLFSENKNIGFQIFKWTNCLLVVYIIKQAGAKGALVTYSLLLLFFLVNHLSLKLIRRIFFLSMGLIPIILGTLYYTDFFVQHRMELGSMATRLTMIQNSLGAFVDNPFVGFGLGNWHNIDKVADNTLLIESNIRGYIQLGSHNLFLQYLVELGGIGILFFITPFVLILRKYFFARQNINGLQKTLLGIILTFLISSFFYRDINFYEGHFSGIVLITFSSIGVLTSSYFESYKVNKWQIIIIAAIALTAIIWYSYFHKVYQLHTQILQLDKKEEKIPIQLWEAMYHPIWKTTHNYTIVGTSSGPNHPIAFEIAQLAYQNNDMETAHKYYTKAAQDMPGNKTVIFNYANFLIRENIAFERAKALLSNLYTFQQGNVKTNLLLAEIALNENRYSKARQFLNTRYLSKVPMLLFLEQKLYTTNYLDNLVGFSPNQKIDFEEFKKNFLKELNLVETYLKEQSTLNDLTKKLATSSKKLDNFLFRLLSKEQFYAYLKDKSSNLYAYKLLILSYYVVPSVLSENQLILIEEVFAEKEIQKFTLNLTFQNNPNKAIEEKEKLTEQLKKLDKVYDKSIKSILSEPQWQAYLKYKTKSTLFN